MRSGFAKITVARSPIMPVDTMTGVPTDGPSVLESVLKRRFDSQNGRVLPTAVVTLQSNVITVEAEDEGPGFTATLQVRTKACKHAATG